MLPLTAFTVHTAQVPLHTQPQGEQGWRRGQEQAGERQGSQFSMVGGGMTCNILAAKAASCLSILLPAPGKLRAAAARRSRSFRRKRSRNREQVWPGSDGASSHCAAACSTAPLLSGTLGYIQRSSGTQVKLGLRAHKKSIGFGPQVPA